MIKTIETIVKTKINTTLSGNKHDINERNKFLKDFIW